MAFPLPPATCTCLLLLALLGNSWGNGTIAPNASVTNGSTVEAKNDPIILEVRMYPGLFPKCLLVFFDSRNLDPLNDRMSRILLLAEPGPGPTVGKIDSQNEWVASKLICDDKLSDAFMLEMKSLYRAHDEMPKEWKQHEEEVSKVLNEKMEKMTRAAHKLLWHVKDGKEESGTSVRDD